MGAHTTRNAACQKESLNRFMCVFPLLCPKADTAGRTGRKPSKEVAWRTPYRMPCGSRHPPGKAHARTRSDPARRPSYILDMLLAVVSRAGPWCSSRSWAAGVRFTPTTAGWDDVRDGSSKSLSYRDISTGHLVTWFWTGPYRPVWTAIWTCLGIMSDILRAGPTSVYPRKIWRRLRNADHAHSVTIQHQNSMRVHEANQFIFCNGSGQGPNRQRSV
jgi:hypothetical protein